MIGRRTFIRLAALMGGGALTGALLTRAQVAADAAGPPPFVPIERRFHHDDVAGHIEAPAYVHWPIDPILLGLE